MEVDGVDEEAAAFSSSPSLALALSSAVLTSASAWGPASLPGPELAEKLRCILGPPSGVEEAVEEEGEDAAAAEAASARFWDRCPLTPSALLEKFWQELSTASASASASAATDDDAQKGVLALRSSPVYSLFSPHLAELAASTLHRQHAGRDASQVETIWRHGMDALALFVKSEAASKLVWTHTQVLSAVAQALMSSGKLAHYKLLFKYYNKVFEGAKWAPSEVVRATGLALHPLAAPFLCASEKMSSAVEKCLSELVAAHSDQPGLRQGLAGLLRICLVRASSLSNKEKGRERAIRRSVKLLPLLEGCDREKFGLLLCKLSRHPSPSRRLAAVECAMVVLRQAEAKIEPFLADCCVHVIIQRCSDKLPSVRTTALSCSWKILANEGVERLRKTAAFMESSLQGLFVVSDTPGSTLSTLERGAGDEGAATADRPSGREEARKNGALLEECFLSPVTPSSAEHSALYSNVVSLFRRRCMDKSAAVRKNSLSALAAILAARERVLEQDVQVFAAGCSDQNSIVRKAAVVSFTWILQHARDVDARVISLLVDCFLSVGAIDPEKGPQVSAIEGLVSAMKTYPTAFFNAIHSSTLTSSFLSSVVKEMKNKLAETEGGIATLVLPLVEAGNAGALMTLAPLVSCGVQLEAKVVQGLFSKLEKREFNGAESKLLFSIIRHSAGAKTLSKRSMEQMLSKVQLSLSELRVEPSNIEAAVSCISSLALLDSETIFDEAIARAESLVRSAVEGGVGEILEEGHETKVESALAVISSAAALKNALPPAETVTRIQALAFSDESIPGSKGFLSAKISSRLRAHALVALGKLALLSENMAKEIVPVLIQLLNRENNDTNPALRNNALVIMCDIATHHTSAVEGAGFDAMTNALGDPNSSISRQALLLLTNLLQRDYMKWKPFTFLRFFPLLGARAGDTRMLASTVLTHVLGKKTPLAAYQYFVEAMFGMNTVLLQSDEQAEIDSGEDGLGRPPAAQSLASSVLGSQRDRAAFAVASKQDRHQVYDMLLSVMKPEHCIAVASRICLEILQPAADALLDMSRKEEASLVADALDVLSMDRLLRAAQNLQRGEHDDEDDMDDESRADTSTAHAAKRQLIQQMMRRVAVNHIAPAIFALDVRLRNECSPLQERLLSVAGVLLAQFTTKLEDLFPTERIFVAEIREHMREAARRKRKRNLEAKKHVEFLIESRSLQADKETTNRVLATPGMTTAAAAAILSPSSASEANGGGVGRRLTPSTTPRLNRAAVDSANKSCGHQPGSAVLEGNENQSHNPGYARHERYRELESIKRRI